MARPRMAVFSGALSTGANAPALVTSNKARFPGERRLPGRFDHLVPQILYEPARVRIQKFSAHPLEADAVEVYHDDGKPYYEVEMSPQDGPYLLPYMARRADGSPAGAPFEDSDLANPELDYGGRQFFYPDASRFFDEIDRTIAGRDAHGEGNALGRQADFDFIRAAPPAGYTRQGERLGVDYFPCRPRALCRRPLTKTLARVTNVVRAALQSGKYAGLSG